MPKQKYIFNTKTLKYEKYKLPARLRLGRVFAFFVSCAAVAFLFLVVFYHFFGSPRERMQAREIEYMKLQYEILNDKMNDMNQLLADIEHRDDDIYRVIFEAEPIQASVRKGGFGGSDRYEGLYGYKNSDLVAAMSRKLDVIASQLYVQSKSYDEVFEMARNKSQMLAAIPAIIPVKETDIKYISSYFGYRLDPIYKVPKFHSGIDFSAPLGTFVYASGDGKVTSADIKQAGYGSMITIDHGFGYQTRYAHLNKFAVRRGQKVKRGQLIGYVGNTGKATGYHLHYEVLKNGVIIDPIHFFFNDLTPEQYDQILEQSLQPSQSMD